MRYVFIVLSAAVLIGGLLFTQRLDRSLALRHMSTRLQVNKRMLGEVAGYLRSYHNTTGRYPSNEEGLLVVTDLVKACGVEEHRRHIPFCYCRVDDSGILSVWGEPLIYENRRGLDPRKFADSGANADTARKYSIKVDDGIYVWSLGAKQDYLTLSHYAPRLRRARILILGIAVLLIVLYVPLTMSAVGREYHGWRRAGRVAWSLFGGAAIWAFLLLLFLPEVAGPTCYAWRIARFRTPKLTGDYLTLMAKYRDQGIISDSAYEKLEAAMRKSPYSE